MTKVDDYAIIVRRLADEDGGGYFAEVVDVPGCGIQGETPEEAIKGCREALETSLEIYKERDQRPPSPVDYSKDKWSGKFVVRMPRTLHRQLSLKASTEGVSLNHLCTHLLSEGLERRSRHLKITLHRQDANCRAPGRYLRKKIT